MTTLKSLLTNFNEAQQSQSLLPADVFLATAFTPFIFLLAAAVPGAFLEYKTRQRLCLALNRMKQNITTILSSWYAYAFMTDHVTQLLTDLWPCKPCQQYPVSWRMSVPSFIEIPPLNTEILHHAKQVFMHGGTAIGCITIGHLDGWPEIVSLSAYYNNVGAGINMKWTHCMYHDMKNSILQQ